MKIIILLLIIATYGCSTYKHGIKEIKTDQTISLPTGLSESTYTMQFRPNPYTEPVSMFPLAAVMVLGGFLVVGGLGRLYEFIKTGK